ncbi:hypothetical protein PUN28_004656 [Cardiocondyla obscurior]|uniref:Uncharacterized protein n=1 Tax=Cardiocondyla obscurior TaxID=286306 RepID=A0AAW2GEM8_9HYME
MVTVKRSAAAVSRHVVRSVQLTITCHIIRDVQWYVIDVVTCYIICGSTLRARTRIYIIFGFFLRKIFDARRRSGTICLAAGRAETTKVLTSSPEPVSVNLLYLCLTYFLFLTYSDNGNKISNFKSRLNSIRVGGSNPRARRFIL